MRSLQPGLCEYGRVPTLRGEVPEHDKGHVPAATDLKDVAALAKAIDDYPTPVTRGALRLATLTAMQPAIVGSARWYEIGLKTAEWQVPGSRMKSKFAHIVSLPTQAIKVLRQMLAYTEGKEFVCPPLARQGNLNPHRPALSVARRSWGFKIDMRPKRPMGPGGFFGRLFASDLEAGDVAHANNGGVQKACARTSFGDARMSAMQAWAYSLTGPKKSTR